MRGRITHITFTLLLVLMLTGCKAGPMWKHWMFEGPPEADKRPYPPLYVEGWKHGCESGASAKVNLWYAFNYKFKQDWQLAQNETYYKGWKDAFDYCQKYLHQYYSSEFL